MPSSNPKTEMSAFETGPGALHYKLRTSTIDKDRFEKKYLADGTEAPTYIDKWGCRMPIVPDIAREG